MMERLEQGLGIMLILIILLDIFLTVLGSGFLLRSTKTEND